jgi:hypothetical protein
MKFAKQRKPKPTPNKALLTEVRIRFLQNGSTLEEFARKHGIASCNLRKAVLGVWTGKKASEWKHRVLQSLNITEIEYV